MKKIMFFFLLVGGSVFAQVKETRQVEDFSSVSVYQGIQVKFTYGEAKSVIVEAEDKELLDEVVTEVTSGGKLAIRMKGKTTTKGKKTTTISYGTNGRSVVVTISNPQLEGVIANSSGKFELMNAAKAKNFSLSLGSSGKYVGAMIQTDNLAVDISSSGRAEGSFEVINKTDIIASSSGKAELKLSTKKLEVSTSSSGKVTLAGTADTVEAKVSSSGKIFAEDCTVRTLEGRASSSGAMTFTVNESVIGNASSSGKVFYKGNAKVEAKTSSSGKVEKVNKQLKSNKN